MKNIKTLAEEIGVSKQAIRNKIASLDLQSSLQKKGNQFLIDEDTENIIRDSFTDRVLKNDRTEPKETNEQESQTTLQLISMLKSELDQKNKQIAELQKIIDQEQQLRLVEHKRLLELEDKLQQQVSDASVAASVTTSTEDPITAEVPVPKKWWQFWK